MNFPGFGAKYQTILLDVVGVGFLLAGLIGLIVNGSELHNFNAKYIKPHFLNIWMTFFMIFYSFQILWNLHLAPLRGPKTSLTLFIYYCLINLITFIIFISNYIALLSEGATWGLFLFFCTLIGTYLAWGRFKLAKEKASASGYGHGEGFGSKNEAGNEDERLELIGINEKTFIAPKTGAQRVLLMVGAGFNGFFLGISLLLLGLLIGGSTIQAQGYSLYSPKGEFISFKTESGAIQKVMVYCTGEFNGSRPTIIFDIGGGGHSSSDLYGMQFALNDQGYRVCSYDYPGCGWSGFETDISQPMILDKILTEINEAPPFVLVGTMDGGPERIYDYALKFPQNVKALFPIDYNPGPSEMQVYKMIRNYDEKEANSYATLTLTGRMKLAEIICSLAVQWGFMSIFAPMGNDYVPAELQREKLFLNLYNEKQWNTQYQYLTKQVKNITEAFYYDLWATNPGIDSNIPVFWIYNNLNMTRQCAESKLSEKDCDEQKSMKDIYFNQIQESVNRTLEGKILQYEDARGMLSQGQYIPWTVQQIISNINSL